MEKVEVDNPWSVYLLQSEKDGSYYIGATTNLNLRLVKHNNGTGAKRTRGRGPWRLIYSEVGYSRSQALKLECAWKKKSRSQKAVLGSRDLDGL